jgi:hypothetical protein
MKALSQYAWTLLLLANPAFAEKEVDCVDCVRKQQKEVHPLPGRTSNWFTDADTNDYCDPNSIWFSHPH